MPKSTKTKIEKAPKEKPQAKKKIAARARKTVRKKKVVAESVVNVRKDDLPVENLPVIEMKPEIDKGMVVIDEEIREDEMDAADTNIENERHFARWMGKDFVKLQEETLFYYASAVACAIAILWAAKDGNWVSLVAFLSLLVVIVFEIMSEPSEIEYGIDIDGISIDGRLYTFDAIKSFEMSRKGGVNVVKLQLKNAIFPTKELYLNQNQDAEFIQALLESFLPEEAHEDMLFSFKKERKLTEDEFIEEKVDEYFNGKY